MLQTLYQRHVVWIWITLAYAGAAWILAAVLGMSDPRLPGLPAIREGLRAILILGGFVAGAFTYVEFVINPVRRRLRRGSDDAPAPPSIRQPLTRLAGLAVVLLFLAPFMDGFGIFKAAIPSIQPFRWDGLFEGLDRVLHLGTDPWRLTHAVASGPLTTRFLDLVYVSWLPTSVGVLMAAALSLDEAWRQRFLLAFLGVWIVIGTIMATAMSSAGPCFVGHFGNPTYADLMERLNEQDAVTSLSSLTIQNSLWSNYVAGSPAALRGISAMPSVHVALSVVCLLALWSRSRPLGWLFGVYTALMFVATVHLGWHYAVDGYLAIAAAVALWWLAGRLIGSEPGSETRSAD